MEGTARANIVGEEGPARANMVGGEARPPSPARYPATLAACALTPDLAAWPAGDLTHIGEKVGAAWPQVRPQAKQTRALGIALV